MKSKLIDKIIYLIIIFFSIIWTLVYGSDQTAVDGALIYSGKVEFPNDFLNVKIIYFNSWVLLHQIGAILLDINWEPIEISRLFFLITISSFYFSIFLIVKSLTKSSIFAFIVSTVILITKTTLGNTDYPTEFFSEHTYGIMSIGLFSLILALISSENIKLSGFTSGILLSIHTVIGLWLLALIVLIFFFEKFILKKNSIFYRNFFTGYLFSLFLVVPSFIFFILGYIEKPNYDENNFLNYLNLWDHHRNIFLIHYSYILKTIIIVLFSIISFLILSGTFTINNKYFIYLFILTAVSSLILYIFYKLTIDFQPILIKQIMPTRFFGLHSVIGYPIIISLFYVFLKSRSNLLKYKYLLTYFVLFVFIIISFDFTKKIRKNFILNKNNFLMKYEENFLNYNTSEFWNKVRDLNTSGYFLTTNTTTDKTLRYALHPYLINVNNLDHIPYHPYTVDEVKDIIENVYGISFSNPVARNNAYIPDSYTKITFEKRDYQQWKKIFKAYKINYLIVPSSWKIDLIETFKNKDFALYKL